MRKENIHQAYQYVTGADTIANADTPLFTLLIPAGRVYRVQNGTPLVLKAADINGTTELPVSSEVYLAWQDPISKEIHQAGRVMNYGIFARISLADQENINTQARRLIEFSDDEIARAARGEESIITGLTADYKIFLMVKSADVCDYDAATAYGTVFNFDAIVLTEAEYLAEKTGSKNNVVA